MIGYNRREIFLSFLLFIIIFLFFLNFIHYPESRSWRDEGTFYYGAERILAGQLIYRDFHEIQFPGSFYFLYILFLLFGNTIETGRIATYIVIASGICTYYLISRNLVFRRLLSFFPCFAIAFVGFPQWAGSLPHWFSFLTNAISIFLTVLYINGYSKKCLFFAGIFSGLSLTIVQNEGLLLFIGIMFYLILYEKFSWKNLFMYFTGFFVVSIFWPLFFIFKGEFKSFVDSTFFYLFKQYIYSNKIPYFGYFAEYSAGELVKKLYYVKNTFGVIVILSLLCFIYFIQYGLIFVYLFASVRILRDKNKERQIPDRIFILLTITGLFLLLSQIHKPDPIRLMFVSFPALIITIYFLDKYLDMAKLIIYSAISVFYLVILLYGIGIVKDIHLEEKCVLDAPGGRVFFKNKQICLELNQLNQFLDKISEKEGIFIHNWATHYYFLFKWRNPVPYDGLLVGHNSEVEFDRALKILKHSPPLFIITDNTIDYILKNPEKSPFPALNLELLKDDPIWEFIRANYREFAFLPASGLTLWRRRGD